MRMMAILDREFWHSEEPLVLGLTPRHALMHYILIPLFLAFLSGWPQVGRTIAWPKYHALGFWMGMSFTGWWLNDAVTRLLARPFRQFGLPLWATLALGVIAASFPSDIILRGWVHGYYVMFPHLPVDRPLPGLEISADKFVKTHIYGYLTWPLVNLAVFHLGKVSMFGYPALGLPGSAAPDSHSRAPTFMAKIPPAVQGRVLALVAEQHYLRVHTENGEALVLYRLSDAMREMGASGLQVHRSYWVAAGAVQRVAGSKASPRLVLANGMEVPVSRSYRQSVEMAGFLKGQGPRLQEVLMARP